MHHDHAQMNNHQKSKPEVNETKVGNKISSFTGRKGDFEPNLVQRYSTTLRREGTCQIHLPLNTRLAAAAITAILEMSISEYV